MDNCLFCKIAAGKMETKLEYEDEEVAAFNDINPKAPVHILIVPKKHIASVAELEKEDECLAGKLIYTAKVLAEKKGLKDGFRLIFNSGTNSGQVVEHIHLHLLGGQKLGEMI